MEKALFFSKAAAISVHMWSWLIFGVECYHCAAGKMEGHSGGMKKLHNTVLQAVIGQLGVIKSNLEGLLPTEDQQGHECITDAIGSVKDAIGDIEEAMD